MTLPWTDLPRAADRPRAAIVLPTGAGVGLFGLIAFGTVHALLILPIWTRLLGGLPFALATGIALAWAFDEVARIRSWRSAAAGVAFGAIIFATLAPATAFSNALRLAGFHAGDWPGTLGSIALALASGTCAGWMLTRDLTATSAVAVATFTLTLASGGPIPVANGPRAAWLYITFLPICTGAGGLTALLWRRFSGLRSRG
jgi:hypothetical protein